MCKLSVIDIHNIPNFKSFLIDIIKILSNEKEQHYRREITIELIKIKNYSENILDIKYNNSHKSIFPDRVAWACSFMYNIKLLSSDTRNYYKITELGKTFKDKTNEEIIEYSKTIY